MPHNSFPKLIAFDLDYTLWKLWIDAHATGPLHRNQGAINEVRDKYNGKISFYREVPELLHSLRQKGIIIAACSRTSAPKLARQALSLLLMPPVTGGDEAKPAIDFFSQLEIYPGSKINHFKALNEKTGIPYSEMLFFDDEHRNFEVEKLGVTMSLVSDGVTKDAFEKGLVKWRKRQSIVESA